MRYNPPIGGRLLASARRLMQAMTVAWMVATLRSVLVLSTAGTRCFSARRAKYSYRQVYSTHEPCLLLLVLRTNPHTGSGGTELGQRHRNRDLLSAQAIRVAAVKLTSDSLASVCHTDGVLSRTQLKGTWMVRMLRMYFTYLLTVGSSVMYLARSAKRSLCFASLLHPNAMEL